MPLSADDIAFLQTERASVHLQAHADDDLSDANALRLLTTLRKSLTAPEAAAVLTTLRLRKKATVKFPRHAGRMLFTDAGLQQASALLARQYRASQFESPRLLDLCCGIGADSLAFAASGREVLGLDIDPAAIAAARHNAALRQLPAQFEVADVRAGVPAGYEAIFYDPARRDTQGRRIHQVERYLPPLSLVSQWRAPEIAVKLSPGVELRQIAKYGGALEFVSVAGSLSEALLWLHRPPAPLQATLLRGERAHHLRRVDGAVAEVSEPRQWLLEPDPSVLRAGLVQTLAQTLGASMLDDSIAYLTLDSRSATPWGRSWRILDWLPFQLKRLRSHLRARGIGRVTVKKRGFAMAPDELIARLRLDGKGDGCVLVMTRCRGQPIAILCAEPDVGQAQTDAL